MNSINELVKEISKLNPIQSSFVENSINSLNDSERSMFSSYIAYCLDHIIDIEFLARSYDLIVKDTVKEQLYFQRHKQYRHSSYKEVASSVYQSNEYMSKYMYGLALSAYLWPNHREMHHFFLDQLPKHKKGNYLEVGPGHGLYFMQSMLNTSFDHYTGVDISPTSVAMTKDIIESQYFGEFDHCTINNQDFLIWEPTDQYDYIVIAEVLEHVEQPELFLAKLAKLLNPSGSAFITTCINAPAIDHIYLYKTVEQLQQQVADANLVIEEQLIVSYSGLTLGETMAQSLPVNIAMSLKAK